MFTSARSAALQTWTPPCPTSLIRWVPEWGKLRVGEHPQPAPSHPILIFNVIILFVLQHFVSTWHFDIGHVCLSVWKVGVYHFILIVFVLSRLARNSEALAFIYTVSRQSTHVNEAFLVRERCSFNCMRCSPSWSSLLFKLKWLRIPEKHNVGFPRTL